MTTKPTKKQSECYIRCATAAFTPKQDLGDDWVKATEERVRTLVKNPENVTPTGDTIRWYVDCAEKGADYAMRDSVWFFTISQHLKEWAKEDKHHLRAWHK